jgi:hypothetical protein
MKVQICGWARSSTNIKTMKAELPEECMKKGCKGFFKEGIKPDCEDFMPLPKSMEKEFKENFAELILEC